MPEIKSKQNKESDSVSKALKEVVAGDTITVKTQSGKEETAPVEYTDKRMILFGPPTIDYSKVIFIEDTTLCERPNKNNKRFTEGEKIVSIQKET